MCSACCCRVYTALEAACRQAQYGLMSSEAQDERIAQLRGVVKVRTDEVTTAVEACRKCERAFGEKRCVIEENMGEDTVNGVMQHENSGRCLA